MSILASLADAYERMAVRGEVPPFGYSTEKIGFLISLDEMGTPACAPIDLRDGDGRKKRSRLMAVPQPVKRTSGIAPNFLWDKTSYALGVTAGKPEEEEEPTAIDRLRKRLVEEHATFVQQHREALADTDDAGLLAMMRFLEHWAPEDFERLGWPEEMRDQNVVFALESDRQDDIRIRMHDRPAARELWARRQSSGEGNEAACLVTGRRAPIARLHPAIKGIWGGQSSGGSIVSYNQDAFESYGHDQGGNAPVSEAAAFAYTTALNHFLEKDSGHRIQIGDASVVFWADGSGARDAEGIFSAMFDGENDSIDEHSEAKKVGATLQKLRDGKQLADFDLELGRDVRFHVLGLAPNASRISVRFWLNDNFGTLADRYQRFLKDRKIEPLSERDRKAPLWAYLLETATLRKRENVPPNIAGDWMRSVLTGTTYPLTLLSTILMRIRADREVNALRVGMLKAVLVRNFNMEREAPVALDPENRNKGYLLGRLFAAYEQIQSAALGRNINSTVKDKFYGSASSQPRTVFPYLEKNCAHHLAKLGKNSRGYRVNLEKVVASIMDLMSPAEDPFPPFLIAEEQALFALGYYHQKSEFFKSKDDQQAPKNEEAA